MRKLYDMVKFRAPSVKTKSAVHTYIPWMYVPGTQCEPGRSFSGTGQIVGIASEGSTLTGPAYIVSLTEYDFKDIYPYVACVIPECFLEAI